MNRTAGIVAPLLPYVVVGLLASAPLAATAASSDPVPAVAPSQPPAAATAQPPAAVTATPVPSPTRTPPVTPSATARPAPTASAAPKPRVTSAAPPQHTTGAPRPHPHRKPWPVTLTVQTVPALPNVRLTLDGQPLTTDANGRASHTEEHNFDTHTLTLMDTAVSSPDRRYRFVRWSGQRDPDQAYRPTVTGLPMRADVTVTAAFAVQYPVTVRFVDGQGRPVDPGTIGAVTLKSDTGAMLNLPTSGTAWLDGVLPKYEKSALVTGQVRYSLQSVVMRGTNVVDAGRQQLEPGSNPTPTFTLQFHDLTIQAHDALFDGAAGSTVALTYPDGTVHTAAFGPDHTVTLRRLPRGPYSVRLKGAHGVTLAEHLVLSRDAAVDLTVVSRADLAAIGAAAALLAVGMLLLGRTGLRRYLRSIPRRLRRPPREGAAVT